jgi:hypothetical protein
MSGMSGSVASGRGIATVKRARTGPTEAQCRRLDFIAAGTDSRRAMTAAPLRLAGAALLLTGAAHAAEPPPDADPLAPSAAVACAAARYRGQALRVEARAGGLVQELRWLTPAGNALRIVLTGPGCRFLEVDGVGQTEARILPGDRP